MEQYLISKSNIKPALERANQYRLLLQPELAISICIDILAVDTNNQDAIIIYILALTDNISEGKNDKKILEVISLLDTEYRKKYYKAIYYERKGIAFMKGSMSKSFAYDLFIKAIELYKLARDISPKDDDNATLRYNSCVRSIENNNLKPRQDLDDAVWQDES